MTEGFSFENVDMKTKQKWIESFRLNYSLHGFQKNVSLQDGWQELRFVVTFAEFHFCVVKTSESIESSKIALKSILYLKTLKSLKRSND